MKKINLNAKSDLDLAKEYILLTKQKRELETKIKNIFNMTLSEINRIKKEIKDITSVMNKISQSLVTRYTIQHKNCHFYVLQKCEELIEENK